VRVRRHIIALIIAGSVGLAASGQPPAATPPHPATTVGTPGQNAPKPPNPAAIPEKAIELFNKKDFTGCYDVLKKNAQGSPSAPQPRVQLALMFFNARDGQDARKMLELAAIEDPGHPDVYLTNASFAFNEGRLTEAVLSLTMALKSAENPRWEANQRTRFTRDSLLGLAACFETRGQWDKAKEEVVELLKSDENNTIYLQRLGAIEFQLGTLDKAQEAFKKGFKLDPTVDPPELRMGMLWFAKKDPTKTEEWLKKAVAAHSTIAKVHRGYGEFLLDQARLSDADVELKEAEKIAPTARDTLFLRGLYYRYMKKFSDAETIFDDLSRKFPADIPVSMNLALCLAESTDKVKQQRAVDIGELVVRQAPKLAEAYSVLGWCYFKIGRLDDAEASLKKSASSGQLALDPAFYLASVLVARGKEEDAYKMLKDALAEKGPFVYRAEAKKMFDVLDKKLPKKKEETRR
jgi:tetratricopeptide (TPR) repeat protein